MLSYAARDAANHAALMPCAEALLSISDNGYAFIGMDIADYSAKTCVLGGAKRVFPVEK